MAKKEALLRNDYEEIPGPSVVQQLAAASGGGGPLTGHAHAGIAGDGGTLVAYARLAVAATITAIWTFLSGKLRVGGGTAADQDLVVVHKDNDSDKLSWDESEDSFAVTKGLDVNGDLDATGDVTGGNVTSGADPGHTHSTVADHDHTGDAGDGDQITVAAMDSTGADADDVPVADGFGGVAWGPVVAGAIGDHAHAGIAGDGGTFDAANLTAGASTDGQVLTSDGATGAAWESLPALANHDHSGDAGDGGSFDAGNLGSGGASDGDVLTADGAGGAAWETPAAGGFTPDFTLWMPDAPPVSPSAYDDEFGDSSLSGIWTEFDPDGHLTVAEVEAGLRLSMASHAGDNVNGVYQALPAGDFTLWTRMAMQLKTANYLQGGICLWENATDTSKKLAYLSGGYVNSLATYLQVMNNYGSWSSTPFILYDSGAGAAHWYLRLRRSGTTYYYDWSRDGLSWAQAYSGTLAFTPSHMGLVLDNNNSGVDAAAVFSFYRYVGSNVGLAGIVSGDRVGMKRA